MIYEIYTYMHLVGFALGFGGAMVSDVMFFSSIKDRKVTTSEFRFMRLGSRMVWIGLLLLFLSGVALVFLNPAILQSSKFLIKVVIVGVIALNGLVFHIYHLPQIQHHLNRSVRTSEFFRNKGYLLTMSGGISVVSWFSAALMGSLPGLPFSFLQLLGIYACLFVSAVVAGGLMHKKIFS